jgi:hypothetical protein
VFVVTPTVTNGATTVCAAGTTGNACIAVTGQVTAQTDASGTTAGHFAVASTATAGRIADGGATLPNGPVCIVGVSAATLGANASDALNAAPFCYGAGTGISDPGGNGILVRTALNTSTNRTLTAGTQLSRIGGDAGNTLTATAEVLSVQFEGRATK